MTIVWVSEKERVIGVDESRIQNCVVTVRNEGSLSSAIGDILQASDNLSRVINSYKTVIDGQVINGEETTSAMPDSEGKMCWDPPNHHCVQVNHMVAQRTLNPLRGVLQLPQAKKYR